MSFIVILEVLCRLLQPYPRVDTQWNMLVLGNPTTISLNMILFSLSILRLYLCVKILKYWSMYTNDNSQRILNLFKQKSGISFLYKSNVKQSGFSTLLVIFCTILYFCALFFKMYEDNKTEQIEFSNFANCIWYLVITMTTSN
jgi:hypothetical protein